MSEFSGKITNKYVKKFITESIPNDSDSFINSLEKYSYENNIPIIDIEVKKMLEVLIKTSNISSVLEIGTAIGYSSLIFSRAMDHKGFVKSYEINEKMHLLAKSNIEKYNQIHKLNLNIELILSDAKSSLKKESNLYDMVFIDAAKGHYKKFYDQIKDNLKKGSIIVSDNVLFRGMIATDKYVKRRKITIVKRMRKYLNFLMNNKSLNTSIIPIGDGVAISYYNGGDNE